MEFNSVYSVKPEFSTEEFLRQVLIHLGTHKDTPIDVVDAQFGEVRVSEKQVLKCTAHVTGTCNASVGYDRQEPYIDYETYKEKIGDTYITRQRPVTKYKTVTDWHPYSVEYAGKATCCAYNSLGKAADDGRVAQALQTLDRSNMTPTEQVVVNPLGLNTATKECTQIVEKNEIKLPGNHYRDKQCKSSVKVTLLVCYKLPYYEVDYTYNGTKYTAECFACGDIIITCNHPAIDIDVTAIVQERTQEEAGKEKKMWRIFYASLGVGIVWQLIFRIIWPGSIVCLILAQLASKKYRTAYTAHSDEISNNVMKSKVDALSVALQKLGYAPLDQAQLGDLDSYSVEGAKPLPDLGLKLLLWWIGTIILSVMITTF